MLGHGNTLRWNTAFFMRITFSSRHLQFMRKSVCVCVCVAYILFAIVLICKSVAAAAVVVVVVKVVLFLCALSSLFSIFSATEQAAMVHSSSSMDINSSEQTIHIPYWAR